MCPKGYTKEQIAQKYDILPKIPVVKDLKSVETVAQNYKRNSLVILPDPESEPESEQEEVPQQNQVEFRKKEKQATPPRKKKTVIHDIQSLTK